MKMVKLAKIDRRNNQPAKCYTKKYPISNFTLNSGKMVVDNLDELGIPNGYNDQLNES